MVWLVSAAALVIVACVALMVRRELSRWQEGTPSQTILVPLRLVNGLLLIMAVILFAVGMHFLVPHPGYKGNAAMMLAYWIFIGLLVCVVFLLCVLDMYLVRRGYGRDQDKILRDVLFQGRLTEPPVGEKKPE